MLLNKIFGAVFTLCFFLFFCICCLLELKIFGIPIFKFSKEIVPAFDLSFCSDSEMALFFFMVSVVTCLVLMYSEFYMDHYNFKKYSFLMLTFFLSMLVFSSSNSFMNFLIGWDGLGVSSLCLIMFYPNKTSSYNSFLTFFFNRLGDLFLLILFGFLYLDGSFFFYLYEKFSLLLMILMIFCASTKGAQFPLSSWLPAAMSAPTPISAMVHSSTLVTAGIFILFKLFYFFHFFSILFLILFLSTTTFLIGGFLSNIELDLKKIVAFSTMSQISMITFFVSLGFLSISLFHMFNHALFKTLIFCACGVLFLFNSSDQMSFSVAGTKFMYNLYLPLFLSVFMMTGLQFSSSFFTKDTVLECVNDSGMQFIFFTLLTGSILTLFYCGSLSYCFFYPVIFLKKNLLGMKFYSWKFLCLICFGMVFLASCFSMIFLLSICPSVSKSLILLICSIMILPFLFMFKFPSSMLYLNLDLIYSKNFVFSKMSNFLHSDSNSFFSSDQMYFKPFILKLNSGKSTKFNKACMLYVVILTILMLNLI